MRATVTMMTISDFPSAWLPLIDSVAKATLVLGAAGAAAYGLRRASAALRHLIWTVALISALVMPVLSIALPRWQLPLVTVGSAEPPVSNAAETASAPAVGPRRSGVERSTSSEVAAGQTTATPLPISGSFITHVSAIAWPQVLLGLWTFGVFLIAARVIAGLLVVQWMARRSERVLDAPWMKLAVELASEVGVPSSITFLRSNRTAMPMACGVMRPAVMMPAEADEWPVERLRIVLLHELAHIKRRDCLTHVVAQIACAFYWFNPLAWVAARNIRTERERACDDLVLSAGTRRSDYADQLLEIARVMRAGRYPAFLAGASLAMAHRSQLEGRLMAILDPRVQHLGMTRLRAAGAISLCFAAVIPLAAVQPWGEAPSAPIATVREAPVQIAAQPAQTPSPALQPTPTPTPTPTGRASSEADAESKSIKDATVAGTVNGTVHGTLNGTVRGAWAASPTVWGAPTPMPVPHPVPEPNVEIEHSDAQAKGDPRMIAALTAALKDSDKEVRETAMHALVQMRDPSIFEPLVQALKDGSADVRTQAAFGLGQLRDRRAVEPLAGALKDQNAEVRQQAAFALGQIRDRGAVSALNAAMKDTDAEVREQAVFALGQLRDPSAIEGLTVALRDANPEVRHQAAFALGQIRDRKAVEPLISALKDTDAEVRQQAAFALGQIRDRAAVEALVIALKDNATDVREQVAFALGQIRDPRAIDGLTAALKDPQASVRQQAAFALGQLAR